MTQPIMRAAVNGYKFDLWCEPEWLPHKDQNYIYETDVIRTFLTFVRPNDICIDAGANVGYHSLLLSNMVGKSGVVLSYEPDPIHFEKLKANIKLNDLANIHAFQHGLWSANGYMDFSSVKGGGYSTLAPMAGNWKPTITTVSVFKLDDIVNPQVNIRLIKIDCEGAEEQILQGAKDLLTRTDVVVMEFNKEMMYVFGSSDRSIRDYMAGLGYDFFVLRRDGGEPFPVPKDMAITVQGNKPHIYNGMFVKHQ